MFEENHLKVYVKRDDLLHPIVTGNKWRKLKEYLLIAQNKNLKGIISFGGAFSNHIYSLAYVCHKLNISLELIIRGDELNENSNDFLKQIADWGAKLFFVDRTNYRNKVLPPQLKTDDKLLIPEGGFSEIGVDSLKDLANELWDIQMDEMFLAVGTGTTLLGLAKYLPQVKLNGILSLSNQDEIENNRKLMKIDTNNIHLWPDFISKKYGKKNTELMEFCTFFYDTFNIKIEPIYTGLMFKSFFDLVQKKHFVPNSTIVLLHSGGVK